MQISEIQTIAKLVEQVKTETSKWAKKAIGGRSTFSWQAGYGAFSVSHSIRDSMDSCMGDDCVNICGDYHMIMASQGRQLRVVAKHSMNIQSGDPVELVTYDGLRAARRQGRCR